MNRHRMSCRTTCLVLSLFILVLCFLGGCTAKRSNVEGQRVSLIALIVKPDKYNNVRATVRGYLRVEENGVALYVWLEDLKYETHISAVWLGSYSEIKTFTKGQLQNMRNVYVAVTGTVKATSFGPANDYNCEMVNIENIKVVPMVEKKPDDYDERVKQLMEEE